MRSSSEGTITEGREAHTGKKRFLWQERPRLQKNRMGSNEQNIGNPTVND